MNGVEFIVVILLIVGLAGVVVTLVEWRRKRVLLRHDFNQDTAKPTHSAQEAIRAEDHARHLSAGVFHDPP